jgi:hypothetical protein
MRKDHENAAIRRSQDRHRTLSALISLSVAVTLGVTAIGCSGQGISEEAVPSDTQASTIDDNPAENALIGAQLEARGYDTSTLQFQGDTVIVEDDIVMSRAVLLHEAEAEATGVVEKGYFLGTNTFSGKSINLSFGAGVSAAWQTALNAARSQWNSKTPKFSQPGPGSAATISVVTGNLGATTFAQGTFPSGRTITINTSYNSAACKVAGSTDNTIEGLPANVKAKVAMHEMGHVLGFDHPPPNAASGAGRTQIAGTASSPNTGTTPSYTTVMAQGCINLTALSSDDILSAAKKYPSCVTVCFDNCTINVDPAQIGPCQAACPSQCGA